MKTSNRVLLVLLIFSVFIMITSCARYEQKIVPFKMPSSYTNATEVAGATIAAKAYSKDEAAGAFGFDIVESGVLPVQIIFDNRGIHPLKVIATRTYLVDVEDNLWPILDQGIAYSRIEKKTELGEILPEGAKSGMLAGAAGAVIGAAIGIVSGTSVGEAAGKGAALGAAAGLAIGGAKGLANPEAPQQIGEDLRNRSLEDRPVPANDISHGFIFFPGEANKQAKELRLAIKEVDTGVEHSIRMRF